MVPNETGILMLANIAPTQGGLTLTLDRLHQQGHISDPHGKAKSVVFTEEGLERAQRLLEQLFAKR